MITLNAQQFSTTIGGLKKWVTKLTPFASSETATETRNTTHYIDIIDRSGSMTYDLDSVVDSLQSLTSLMGEEDYRTIIWFSGTGECRTLLKGVKADIQLNPVLDQMRTSLGLTCFSESLEEAKAVIQELQICDHTVINLFTDGHPTVGNLDLEIKKCLDLVSELGLNQVLVNTIGFGNYYNRDFLIRLAASSGLGEFHHIKDIQDLSVVYASCVDQMSMRSLESVKIKHDLIYANPGSGSGSFVYLPFMAKPDQDEQGTQIYLSSDLTESFYLLTEFKLKQAELSALVDKPVTVLERRKDISFPWIYAAALYPTNRKSAVQALTNAKDKGLIESVLNSFTYDEMADCQNQLRIAAFDPSQRYLLGKTPPNFIPSASTFCMVDLFKTLAHDFYVPQILVADTLDAKFNQARLLVSDYKRVRRQTVDNFNLFNAESVSPIAVGSSLVLTESRLNMSLRFKIDGFVKLNPKAASAVGLAQNYPCSVYRTHTFVRDGSLNLGTAEFLVSPETFMVLKSVKSIKIKAWLNEVETNKIRVILDFSKLPIINQSYIAKSNDLDLIYQVVQDLTRLQARQKACSYFIDVLGNKEQPKTGTFASLTDEQVRVLTEHGISQAGIYGGIDNKRELKDNLDYYEVRELSFYLKNVSSLPSVSAITKKLASGKAFTTSESILFQALNSVYREANNPESVPSSLELVLEDANALVLALDWSRLKTILDQIKSELRIKREALSIYKMALVLTGSWFEGLDPTESMYKDMVVKAARVKEYINP